MQIKVEKQNQEAKHKYEGLFQDLHTYLPKPNFKFSLSFLAANEKEKSDFKSH